MKSLIIDDKSANIDTLSKLLGLYCPQVQVCGTAGNVEDGYKAIQELRPALVFLDIEMPNGNGFDLLKKFNTLSFEVIFTTAYNQYAVQAFRENVLDYLLKPIDIDILQQAVVKAEHRIIQKQTNEYLVRYMQTLQPTHNNRISIPVLDGYLFLNCQDIIRCEASDSYCFFFTTDGKKILASMRLKECETLLPSNQFFRVHHSHIINLQYMVRYIRGRGGSVVMQDKSIVEVAASKKDAFLGKLRDGF